VDWNAKPLGSGGAASQSAEQAVMVKSSPPGSSARPIVAVTLRRIAERRGGAEGHGARMAAPVRRSDRADPGALRAVGVRVLDPKLGSIFPAGARWPTPLR
jgi:hypothetical protein